MPQSYTCLHYHLIFSTKNRLPLITAAVQARLWEYLGGIVKIAGGNPIQIGGFCRNTECHSTRSIWA